MYASRNIERCTKDCLCLFVCPTGATDTETGQIDKSACIDGCRLCVDACPSHAIYLVPERFLERKVKDEELSEMVMGLCSAACRTERMADGIAQANQGDHGGAAVSRLARALERDTVITAGRRR